MYLSEYAKKKISLPIESITFKKLKVCFWLKISFRVLKTLFSGNNTETHFFVSACKT